LCQIHTIRTPFAIQVEEYKDLHRLLSFEASRMPKFIEGERDFALQHMITEIAQNARFKSKSSPFTQTSSESHDNLSQPRDPQSWHETRLFNKLIRDYQERRFPSYPGIDKLDSYVEYETFKSRNEEFSDFIHIYGREDHLFFLLSMGICMVVW